MHIIVNPYLLHLVSYQYPRYMCIALLPSRVSARKKFMGGGGQLENTNLLKKGICLLNTFLKDFTKMPITKNTVLQFDGGDIPPLPKS